MFWIWFICAAVFNFSPVHLFSKELSRSKRSDDFIPCDKGWFLFREKCLRIRGRTRNERANWENAENRCKQEGGSLASIHSKEEYDFIVGFLLLDTMKDTWIGLNDRANQTDFTWTDGSVFNYSNWNVNEPRHLDKEDCVELIWQPVHDIIGKWNDVNCDNHNAYICQTKINRRKKSQNPMYCPAEEGGGLKFRDTCYYMVMELKTWDDAEQYCVENYGGHLATVLDYTVDLYLDHILSTIRKDFWIGMKIKDEVQQKWTSGWFVAYNRTNKDYSDVIEGTCVLRNSSKIWNTIPCSKKHSFICETSKAGPPALKPDVEGSRCPEIPNNWKDLGGERCYYFETKNLANWYKANYECKRRGGNLLSLHSKEESDILQPFFRFINFGMYIGMLRLMIREEVFVWSDGSPVDFENWSNYEPSGEAEKCVEIWPVLMDWNDVWCSESRGYICYVRKIAPNSTIIIDGTEECAGTMSYTVLIGVSVCLLLVVCLIGVVVYCFRSWNEERRQTSTATSILQNSPSNCRSNYRFQPELKIKEEDIYEPM